MLPTRLLVALGLVLACAASSHAQPFNSTKVVETGVSYPGFGTLTQLVVRPSLSGNTIAFGGNFATGPVLATASSGTITAIASTATVVPGGTGVNFNAFSAAPIGLSGNVYAFFGTGTAPGAPGNLGIFSNVTGSLNPVVSGAVTAYPGGGVFRNVTDPSVSGSTISFTGTNVIGGPPIGVFTRTGSGSIVTVASPTTPMPGGGGNFFSFADPSNNVYITSISGTNVVFGGRNSTGSNFGLFLWNGSTISAVATNTTPIPNGGGNFLSLSPVPALSGSNVAFSGTGAAGQVGIYRSVGGVLSRVADNTTTVPGATGTFDSFLFTDVAISGDRVAFRGHGTGGTDGIYTDLGGSLTKVIAIGDTLDGKTVSQVNIGHHAFDGNSIALMVGFSNGSAGVYTFTPVPEPTCLVALGAAGLFATRLRKRR